MTVDQHVQDHYQDYTYDMFMFNMGAEPEEIDLFDQWIGTLSHHDIYSFECARQSAQTTEVTIHRNTGESYRVVNMSSYNYLGFGYHPEVIKAAQDAVAIYGLGASSSPVISGTYVIHKQLEQEILRFFGQEGYGVSLFSSGYSVNLGVIQAFIKPGNHVVLDECVHMSIVEGARLSGGTVTYFKHNDMVDLEEKLQKISDGFTRVLICAEGVYSHSGQYANLQEIVRLAKQYGAYTLVDEAHSVLLAGEHGRGVSEQQGVLDQIDLYVMTFSKGFGGVGGAVYAKKAFCMYINWYAKCRMFSCALDPAVTGGMCQSIRLAGGEEGRIRRARLFQNVGHMRTLLDPHVFLMPSDTWILSVGFFNDKSTLHISDYLQKNGLDTSILQFPAVKKNEGKIRLFITSEHTFEQLERAASILIEASKHFGFSKESQ